MTDHNREDREDDGRIRIWVNARAKMSRGKYAAAAVHAALTAAGVHPGVPVIVLGGQRDHIEKMCTVIHDAGRTEVEPGTATAGTDYVFEQAHTPTSDERERRTVQGEPSAEEWAARAHAAREKAIAKGYTPDHDAEHGIRHLLNWAIDYARRGRAEDSSGLILSALALLDSGPQGEPTDAQVLAALNAAGHAESKLYESAPDLGYFAKHSIDAMRATLRAAFKTEGEGR